MNSESIYDELWQRVGEAPTAKEQIGVLQELVNVADSNQEIEVAYFARKRLIRSALDCGFPEKAVVAFSWCLSKLDQDEELDDWHSVLWQYKVVLEWIPVFASVTRDQIIQMQEDMAKRLARHGSSERTAHYYRSWNFMRLGDYETALEFQEKYTSMRRDGLSDCRACEQDRQVELLSRMQQDEAAMKKAQPILTGKMACAEVPEFTNAHVCRSLLRLNRIDEAQKIYQKAYNRVKSERKYLGTIGDLLLVPIRTGDVDTAFNHAKNHMDWAADTSSDELRFRFFASCQLMFEVISRSLPKVKLRVPKQLAFHREDGSYDSSDLAGWFGGQAREMAQLFNSRNGNQAYSEWLDQNRELAGR